MVGLPYLFSLLRATFTVCSAGVWLTTVCGIVAFYGFKGIRQLFFRETELVPLFDPLIEREWIISAVFSPWPLLPELELNSPVTTLELKLKNTQLDFE
jgi:hypothetical protein